MAHISYGNEKGDGNASCVVRLIPRWIIRRNFGGQPGLTWFWACGTVAARQAVVRLRVLPYERTRAPGGTNGTEKPRDSGNCPGPAQGEHEPSLARSSLAPAGRRRLGLSDERAPTAPLLAAPGKERSRADSKCGTRNDPIGTPSPRHARSRAPPAHGTSGEEQQHA